MKRKILVAVTMIAASAAAFAQFGGLGGGLGGLTGGSSSGSSVSSQQIVSGYVKGQRHVLTGQQSMIRALGLKSEEAKLVLEAQALTEKPTKSDVEESKTVVESGSRLLGDAMKSDASKMSEASKKEFSKGVASLAKGIREYVLMSGDAKNFKPSPASIDSSTMAAATIVPSLPTSIETLSSTLKAAITFMQDHKMPPLEKNATAGLPGF